MYKEASPEFDEQIRKPGRTFTAKLISGETSIATGFHSLNVYGSSNSEETITIGSTVSQYIEVEMDKPSVEISGKEWELQFGLLMPDGEFEYIPMGLFTPEKPTTNNGLVKFTAYDRMIKLSGIYICSLSTINTLSVLNDISEKTGVPIKTDELSAIDMEKPEGYTYREVVMYITQLYGKFANVNRTGTIEFHWWTEVEGYELTADDTNGFEHDETEFVLQNIICATGYDEDENEISISVGDGVQGISISNPFMKQVLLNNIYAVLGGFSYTTSDVNCPLGDLRLDPWDLIMVKDKEGDSYRVPVMKLYFSYDGGVSARLSSVGYSKEESEVDYKGPMQQFEERIIAKVASINYLVAKKASIDDLEALTIRVNNITAGEVTVEYLKANYASMEYLQANYLKTVQLEAEYIKAEAIEANYARLDKANIENGWITSAMIAEGVVGTVQIADGSITDAKIVDLTANKITAGVLDAGTIEVINLKAANITVGTINGQQIAPGAIDVSKIAENAVTSGNIVVNAVTTDKIAAGAISADKIATNAITSDKIVAGAITAGKIAAGAISADKIAANTVTSGNIVAGAVTTDKIAANAVTASKINVNDLFAQNITATGSITGATLNGASGNFDKININTSLGLYVDDPKFAKEIIKIGYGDVAAGTTYYSLVIGSKERIDIGNHMSLASVSFPCDVHMQEGADIYCSKLLGGMGAKIVELNSKFSQYPTKQQMNSAISSFLTTREYIADNVSINSGGIYKYTPSLGLSGYTPVGMVGFSIGNATSSGQNGSYCMVTTSYKTSVGIRNTHSSAVARIKIALYVLYVKNSLL